MSSTSNLHLQNLILQSSFPFPANEAAWWSRNLSSDLRSFPFTFLEKRKNQFIEKNVELTKKISSTFTKVKKWPYLWRKPDDKVYEVAKESQLSIFQSLFLIMFARKEMYWSFLNIEISKFSMKFGHIGLDLKHLKNEIILLTWQMPFSHFGHVFSALHFQKAYVSPPTLFLAINRVIRKSYA